METTNTFGGSSFVKKLYDMVDGEWNDIIYWVGDGTAFEVRDPKRLECEVLPKFFRHSRFQSLVRQLNFYAFKKVNKERSSWVYSHDFFQRSRPDLLEHLRRKTSGLAEKRLYSTSLNKKRRRVDTSSPRSEDELSDEDESSPRGVVDVERDRTHSWDNSLQFFHPSTPDTVDSSLDPAMIREILMQMETSPAATSDVRCVVEFCMTRNPYTRPLDLFADIYGLLMVNPSLTKVVNGYNEVLCSSPRRREDRTSVTMDYSSESSDDGMSLEDGLLSSECILRANELTVVRTFMAFAVTTMQMASNDLFPENELFHQALLNCTDTWWGYARMYT